MTAREVLYDIAVAQHGFITIGDAREHGIDEVTVQMLAYRKKLERVARGVYRAPQIPASAYDHYALAVLWTGVPDACLSHETALAVREVCDINPTKIHLTVPRLKRLRRQGGDLYELHHEDLDAKEVGWWEQIRTVTLHVAVRQCISVGVPEHLLTQAISNGRRRGELLPHEARSLRNALQRRAPG